MEDEQKENKSNDNIHKMSYTNQINMLRKKLAHTQNLLIEYRKGNQERSKYDEQNDKRRISELEAQLYEVKNNKKGLQSNIESKEDYELMSSKLRMHIFELEQSKISLINDYEKRYDLYQFLLKLNFLT